MMRPLSARSIVDTHTHTRFSDGVGTFLQNADAAVKAGCAVMVATDHLTLPHAMDPAGEVQVIEDELAAHRQAFAQRVGRGSGDDRPLQAERWERGLRSHNTCTRTARRGQEPRRRRAFFIDQPAAKLYY